MKYPTLILLPLLERINFLKDEKSTSRIFIFGTPLALCGNENHRRFFSSTTRSRFYFIACFVLYIEEHGKASVSQHLKIRVEENRELAHDCHQPLCDNPHRLYSQRIGDNRGNTCFFILEPKCFLLAFLYIKFLQSTKYFITCEQLAIFKEHAILSQIMF